MGVLPSSGLGNIGAAVGSPNSPGAGPNFGSFGGMAPPPPATPFAGTQLPTGNAGIYTGGMNLSPVPQQGAGMQQQGIPGAVANAMHASGLPNQAPGGIHPQLWSSILSHLQQTNFRPQHGAGGAPPARWAPLPSMMSQRGGGGGGTSFMGYR
jgi:hypothetical protein